MVCAFSTFFIGSESISMFVNALHALISPVPKGSPLPLVLLGKSKNALVSTFLFLDQIVWLSRTGIYKDKERAELLGRISLFCWMGSSVCTSLVEIVELSRLSRSIQKLEKEIGNKDKHQNEQYRMKLEKTNERSLHSDCFNWLLRKSLLESQEHSDSPPLLSLVISYYHRIPSPRQAKNKAKT